MAQVLVYHLILAPAISIFMDVINLPALFIDLLSFGQNAHVCSEEMILKICLRIAPEGW